MSSQKEPNVDNFDVILFVAFEGHCAGPGLPYVLRKVEDFLASLSVAMHYHLACALDKREEEMDMFEHSVWVVLKYFIKQACEQHGIRYQDNRIIVFKAKLQPWK